VAGALVEVPYNTTKTVLQRLHQLVRSRGSMLAMESSSSFELVIHQTPGESLRQSTLGSLGGSDLDEALYEEVEDLGSGARLEDEGENEDEGIVMEGDAGFPWGDTRMEQWKWEEEHGEGDYRKEDDDEEDIFEFQYGDDEEDWG
jgi:hypothetical protein